LNCSSSYYLYWIRIKNRNELARILVENGVYCTFKYFPLHLIEFYKHGGGSLENSELINDTTLNLPIHQNLTDDDVQVIVDLVKRHAQ